MPAPKGSRARNHGADPTLDETTQLEFALLGCILKNPSLIGEIEVDLAGDFVSSDHRALWRAAVRLHADGVLLDPILWHESSQVDVSYIALIVASESYLVENFREYLTRVQDASRARRFARLYEELENASQDDRQRILEQMQQTVRTARVVEETKIIDDIRPDLPSTALDGRLGEICQRYLKDFPLAYSWPTLLTIAGSEESLKTESGIRSNLFLCKVGDVGSGKSVVDDHALHALGISKNDPIIVPGKFGSAEGLATFLRDAGSCSRLLATDELSNLLQKCAIEFSSFPSFLMSAFYLDAQKGGGKRDNWTLDCRLSLMGGIVEEYFQEAFGFVSLTGLYDRFLFGLQPRPHAYDYLPPDGTFGKRITPHPPQVDRDIYQVRNEWKKQGIDGRLAEISLRCAFICAAFDCRPILRGYDLEPALALAKYQRQVREHLKPNPGQNFDAKSAAAILSWLEQHVKHGEWIRRRDLARGVHSERLGPGVFMHSLNHLQFTDEIEIEEGMVRLR